MGSLREAVGELNQWRADHENILQVLGLAKGLSSSQARSAAVKHGGDKGSSSSKGRSSGDTSVSSMDVDDSAPEGDKEKDRVGGEEAVSAERSTKITLQNLSACIHAAEKITVGRSLKEVREMRSVLQTVNDWIDKCQSLCPRRQSKRRVQPTNKPTFERLQDLIADGFASPVRVSDEVNRIRRHIAEAESWQKNAQSVLEGVCCAFADQTLERMVLWRKEEEEEQEEKKQEEEKEARVKSETGQDLVDGDPSPASIGTSVGGTEPGLAPNPAKEAAEPPAGVWKKEDADVEMGGAAVVAEGNESPDDGSDADDREDELDEAEETNIAALQELLTTARDISVFMPEELVTERILKILEWAR